MTVDLSVVVPTLNDRERLAACLDSLSEHAPDAEVVVVNGPSTDGTTGMVRDRGDVDVLVELADRNLNTARNAGVEVTTGDVVAVVGQDKLVEAGWLDGVVTAIRDGADVVTGPTQHEVRAGVTTENVESRTIAGQPVTYFNGDNVAFTRETIEAVDGFDEYLETGGARDCAHRLAKQGREVAWSPDVYVISNGESTTDHRKRWGAKYRSLSYRLVKNYWPRLTVYRRTFRDAAADALVAAGETLAGDTAPSTWLSDGREVLANILRGSKDGMVARIEDRSDARNPHGISSRRDRAVERYDWR